MKSCRGVAGPALVACCMLVLAGCGTPPVPEAAPVAAQQVRTELAKPTPPAAPAPPAPPASPMSSAATSHSLSAMSRSKSWLPGPPAYRPAAPAVERFPDKEANKSVLVADQPVSTFSADVDTASYAFVRRTLADGRLPPPDAVRVEEMVNYFPYHYTVPRTAAQPFSVTTEVMPSPWKAGNQLVHIAVRGYDIGAAARPRLNIVLLVDVSGSMMPPDRLPLLRQGFRMFAEQLRDDDRVAIVSYASGTRTVLEPTEGKQRGTILDALDALRSGGGTAGADGLQRAYEMAERHFDRDAVNRVILATDGDFNLGITNPKQLENFIADKRKSGIYLSILGVGTGNLNDALMQRLAQTGNGNAAYIDSLLEARKVLEQELASTMFPIANDLKVQVEFNPAQVTAYRLIGYETRALQRQDFNDDRVDAGDVGAGHTVTALYEITPAGAGAKLVDPPRYQGNQRGKPAVAKDGGELCFVKLRYKVPGDSASRLVEHPVRAAAARKRFEAAPADQRFAVAVAAFAQRLRGEAALADTSYADIAALANAARGDDAEGYRAEFVKLVRTAETLDRVGVAGR
jgi:Ca-activated chloride channel family protein